VTLDPKNGTSPKLPYRRLPADLKQAQEALSLGIAPEIKFAADSLLEGGVRCELVSAAGPSPPIKGSFIAGLMNS
jgi:hypothetical protein